jgi:putative acetyltransferase
VLNIREDDLSGEEVRALLSYHLSEMRGSSPPGRSFALDLSGLREPGVTVWTGWFGDSLAAVGALKALRDGAAEVKSMRTHPEHLRKGAAAALLEHIISKARERGFARLALETGSGPAFEAALSLYRRRGFTEGAPFGDYVASPFNRFFHLPL